MSGLWCTLDFWPPTPILSAGAQVSQAKALFVLMKVLQLAEQLPWDGRRTDPNEVFSACVHAYPEPPAQ